MREQDPKRVEESGTEPQHRPRRWRWMLLTALLLILLHVPMLRAVGEALTPDAPQGDFDAVVLLGGDHRLQVAVDLIDSGRAGEVWLIEGRPSFVVRSGILPSGFRVLQERLIEMGLAESQVNILRDPEVGDLPDTVRLLRERLAIEAEPRRLLVVCSALSGRHVRLVLDDVLEPHVAAEVAILGLPYDRFDVNAWWRSRSGLKHVFGEVCALGFTLVAGTQPQDPPPLVDPAAIEADLRQRFGEAACYAQ